MYGTFTVTHFDPQTGHGHAEQTASAMGFPLCTERLSFDTGVGNGICEYFLDGLDSGIRIPSEEIAQRVPEVGTIIRGVIALEFGDKTAIGEDGLPFLRNWFYEDQADNAARSNSNDYEDFDPTDRYDAREEDDYVTPDMVLARARAAFPNNPEQAAEAARTCPGDFI